MVSKYSHLYPKAVDMRKRGTSLRDIERDLGIPKSTLSGWLRSVHITPSQKKKLLGDKAKGLMKARELAAIKNRSLKVERLRLIEEEMQRVFNSIPSGKAVWELALAMLYLGEGSKTRELGLGNSNPVIVRFYIDALEKIYGLDRKSLRADLHLRADQDEANMRRYWSKVTGIPLRRFTYAVRDKRTAGKPTYEQYKGVCYIAGGGLEIQRRLGYLATVFLRDMRG